MGVICRKGKEIKILKSYAGYYLGTELEDGCPYCRCSTQYAPTKEEAENLVVDRFYAVENMDCHGGKGCIVYGNSEDNN